MRNIKNASEGFTLIEVLVVVAILGILTAITQLAYFNIGTDEACDSVCATNLRYLEAEWFVENVLVVADADVIVDGDADRGHGNDTDGWDEDNPGNNHRHRHFPGNNPHFQDLEDDDIFGCSCPCGGKYTYVDGKFYCSVHAPYGQDDN